MKKIAILMTSLTVLTISIISISAGNHNSHNGTFQPTVMQNYFGAAKNNLNWKIAYLTGKNGQIVFMNITPQTNPKNEIGTEVHSFDQFIFIVQGNARAELNGKTSLVKEGDIIFVPEGTRHNVINLNKEKPLKIISFYSENDMPKDAVYRTKADQPPED